MKGSFILNFDAKCLCFLFASSVFKKMMNSTRERCGLAIHPVDVFLQLEFSNTSKQSYLKMLCFLASSSRLFSST